MEIIKVDKYNVKRISEFLESLKIIKDINEKVVLNGEYIDAENEIIGFSSYEEFNRIGLIRYFILKKVISQDIINEMFDRLCSKAKKNGIEILITLVVRDEAIHVFNDLGFEVVDKKDVYLEEMSINNTRFKGAIVLKCNL